MTDIDANSLRTARDEIDRIVHLVSRVIERADDPDGDLTLAVQDLQIARDRLRRHGHDAQFDLVTKETTP